MEEVEVEEETVEDGVYLSSYRSLLLEDAVDTYGVHFREEGRKGLENWLKKMREGGEKDRGTKEGEVDYHKEMVRESDMAWEKLRKEVATKHAGNSNSVGVENITVEFAEGADLKGKRVDVGGRKKLATWAK